MADDDGAAFADQANAALRSVPISALEHLEYCPRQAALIHVEDYFASNAETVRGDLAHAAVDDAGAGNDRRRGRLWRSLPVWHDGLGIHGICDVVQFTDTGPLPVEHKSGRYKPGGPADVQVGAQAMCLRAMFDAEIPFGVVFCGRDRRRHEVVVDDALEGRVLAAARRMRALYDEPVLPPPVNDHRCRRCSLIDGCMPGVSGKPGAMFLPRSEGSWRD